MEKFSINYERCKGCGLCVSVCPKKILMIDTARLNRKGYNPVEITDRAACISCAMCATMCPDCVITIED
ncbi:4Fe-4S binding protein [Phocea massiliensis]|uniref:4Fe-4S binding protein n=1 Tax=Merdimmobilis hominis TaxID=2897707 RepID=A0A938X829_9FIRM|nr:4Fe-4S binding protein [Merdimmobilis hominis]MBM6920931.1 4Fe-4S binding protein [Merdimmobilis hominis]